MKLLFEGPIYEKISEVGERLDMDVYLVGGLVRDRLLGIPNDDIDLVVIGSGLKFAEEFAKETNSSVQFFRNFGTARVLFNGIEIEFVGARKESYNRGSRKPIIEDGTLLDDLTRRDFSVNTLAVSLRKRNFGEVIDLFNGLEDLKKKILRTPTDPNITFSDDPLRILRGLRFMSTHCFSIDPTTYRAMEKNINRIHILSKERIGTELNKLICGKNPVGAFNTMNRMGLLKLIIPELSNLDITIKDADQVHHKNNFIHSLKVLRHMCDRCSNVWIRWAALLHDIGKGPTRRFNPAINNWTFYDHERVGAKMIEPIFRRLSFPLGPELRFVQKLVNLHMRPSMISTHEITDSAVRRLLYDAGNDIEALMTLCECDITTKNKQKECRLIEHFVRLRHMLDDLIQKDTIRLFQPCIKGDQIMKILDLRPGKEVGIIKEGLKNAILDGKCKNEPEELIKLAIEMYVKIYISNLGNPYSCMKDIEKIIDETREEILNFFEMKENSMVKEIKDFFIEEFKKLKKNEINLNEKRLSLGKDNLLSLNKDNNQILFDNLSFGDALRLYLDYKDKNK